MAGLPSMSPILFRHRHFAWQHEELLRHGDLSAQSCVNKRLQVVCLSSANINQHTIVIWPKKHY